MTTITDADREAAHATIAAHVQCGHPGWEFDWHTQTCDSISQAIAIAREAGEKAGAERENRACEAKILEFVHDGAGGDNLVNQMVKIMAKTIAARRAQPPEEP